MGFPVLQQLQLCSSATEPPRKLFKCSICLNCHHRIKWADLTNQSYPHLPKWDLLAALKNRSSFLRKCQAAQKCNFLSWEAPGQGWLCWPSSLGWCSRGCTLLRTHPKRGNPAAPDSPAPSRSLPAHLSAPLSTHLALWRRGESLLHRYCQTLLLHARDKQKKFPKCKKSCKECLHSSKTAPTGTLLHGSCSLSDA